MLEICKLQMYIVLFVKDITVSNIRIVLTIKDPFYGIVFQL